MGCSSSKPVEVIEPTSTVPSLPPKPSSTSSTRPDSTPDIPSLPPSTPHKPKVEEDINTNQTKVPSPSVQETTVPLVSDVTPSAVSSSSSAETVPAVFHPASVAASSTVLETNPSEVTQPSPTTETVPSPATEEKETKKEAVETDIPKEVENEEEKPVVPTSSSIPVSSSSSNVEARNQEPTVNVPIETSPVVTASSSSPVPPTPVEVALESVPVPSSVPSSSDETSSLSPPSSTPSVPIVEDESSSSSSFTEPVSNIGATVTQTLSSVPPPPPPPGPPPPPPAPSPPVAVPPPPPKRGPGTMSPETRKKAINGLSRAAAITKALGNLTTAAMKAVDRSHAISMVTVKRLLRGDKTVVESILQQITTSYQLSYESMDILVSLPMYVVSTIIGSAFKHLLTELHNLEKTGTTSFDATLPKALQSLRSRFSEPQHIKDVVRAGDAATLLAYLNIFPMPENLTTGNDTNDDDSLNSTVTAVTVSHAKRQLDSLTLTTVVDYANFRQTLLGKFIGAGTFFQKFIVEPTMPADTVANQIQILRRTIYNSANNTVTEKDSTVQDTYTAAESTLHYVMRGFDSKECPHIATPQERMADSIKILQANFSDAQTLLLKTASEKVANVWAKGMEGIANTVIKEIQSIDTKAPNASKLLNEISDNAKVKLEDYFISLTAPPKFTSAPTPVRGNDSSNSPVSTVLTDKELYDSIPIPEMNTLKTLAKMKKDDLAWASVMQAARICADLIHDEELASNPSSAKANNNNNNSKLKVKGDKKGGKK